MAADNRAFTGRAVTWAARQGVTRFLDLGTGLPARPAVHETARDADPSARVVYLDHDPVVFTWARHLLATGEGIAAVEADLTDPAAVLAHPDVLSVIDLAEPVCVILGPVLSLMPAPQAREVVAGYASLVAPGSLVIVSCLHVEDDTVVKELAATCTAAGLHNHSCDDLGSFLAGLELIPPGIGPAAGLRPGWGSAPSGAADPAYVLGAIARKR